MKKHFILFAAIVVTMLTACRNEQPTDPHNVPYPQNELMDLSVRPGDDFYHFGNGTWMKNHPLPAGEPLIMYWNDPAYGQDAFINAVYAGTDDVMRHLVKHIDNTQYNGADIAAVRTATLNELNQIDGLQTLSEVYGEACRLALKGYPIGLQITPYTIEQDIRMIVEVLLPEAITADMWEEMTGCTKGDAQSYAATCQTIHDAWEPLVGFTLKTTPYTQINDGLRLMTEAIGVEPGELIYGETIDQDLFFNTTVTQDNIENWRMWIKEAIVRHNYNWTHATRATVSDYLYAGCNPLVYRLTKQYSELYCTNDIREYVYNMVEELRASFIGMIETNDWLTDKTRNAAITKAKQMHSYVGYPDHWSQKLMGSVPAGNSLLESMSAMEEEWATLKLEAYKEGPTEDNRWYSIMQLSVPAYQTNAMNITENNALYIFMPIILPPACRMTVDDAYNYGMLGAVAGHEIGHGFDGVGSLFNERGEWQNWWEDADWNIFQTRAKALADLNSQFEALPGLYSRGEQTSVEDVADLNGMNAAYRAMLAHYQKKGANEEQMLQAKRMFFIGYANLWAANYSDEYIRHRVETNIHSVGELRVNGIVRHMQGWYDAFDVQPGDQLYLAPQDRIKIWNKD